MISLPRSSSTSSYESSLDDSALKTRTLLLSACIKIRAAGDAGCFLAFWKKGCLCSISCCIQYILADRNDRSFCVNYGCIGLATIKRNRLIFKVQKFGMHRSSLMPSVLENRVKNEIAAAQNGDELTLITTTVFHINFCISFQF